jgi:type II secretory pathway pseudopilin PulG
MFRRGSSIVELMFSILILGVGLTGVASLFPTAAAIQRDTFEDVLGSQVAQNVRGAIGTRGFAAADMPVSTGRVQPVNPAVLQGPGPAAVAWTLHDRCYPAPVSDDPQAIGGSHYWVPLVRKPLTEDYRVFIFVLHRIRSANYGPHIGAANPTDPDEVPAVRATPATPLAGDGHSLAVAHAIDSFAVGDHVLSSEGQVLRIVDVSDHSIRVATAVDPNTNAVWYGSRYGSHSSTRQILTLDNIVR